MLSSSSSLKSFMTSAHLARCAASTTKHDQRPKKEGNQGDREEDNDEVVEVDHTRTSSDSTASHEER